ncbi:uncharacterized protein METZ01_LOCUS13883 [marine metagenome]|uniref:Metallo-beta-lactamase domain-containing protein n=1 Tax=marine metagenome TaxID=408172 RepID=A0A381P3X4_9ZZZZ
MKQQFSGAIHNVPVLCRSVAPRRNLHPQKPHLAASYSGEGFCYLNRPAAERLHFAPLEDHATFVGVEDVVICASATIRSNILSVRSILLVHAQQGTGLYLLVNRSTRRRYPASPCCERPTTTGALHVSGRNLGAVAGLALTVLGCSGSYAGADQACSGYLIRSASTIVWVDCGPGTLANLQKHVSLDDIDAIVVSHHHPDHCAELPVVYNAYRYFTDVKRLRALGTADVRRVTDAFHPNGDTGDFFDWEIVSDGSVVEIGDIEVKFSQTDHPVETLAMRFSCEDISIFYTSDTGREWSLAQLGHGPDIVLGEGTLTDATDSPSIPHISCAHLAADANKVGAKRLVVTHVPPGSDPLKHLDEAAAMFDGNVELAVTGRTFSTI